MKKKALLLSIFLLTACSKPEPVSEDMVRIIVEQGYNFSVVQNTIEIKRGENATFHVKKNPFSEVLDISYTNYTVENYQGRPFDLTLDDVMYSLVLTITMSDASVAYHANGGESYNEKENIRSPLDAIHLRQNSLDGTELFYKKGYLAIGWNTKMDGSGQYVPFGSRIPYGVTDLFVQWEKESDSSLFLKKKIGPEWMITQYLGTETEVVVPQEIDGIKVAIIGSNAFNNLMDKIYFSPNIRILDPNAINSRVNEVFLFDNIQSLAKTAFPNTVKTLHVNAKEKPRFSGTYYDTFPDKVDYLARIFRKKKIVLFSGSSTRYGYDSTLFDQAFPDRKTVNMGVFAYVNIKPQLDVISHFLNVGDILISSPEFDEACLDDQFAVNNTFDWNLFAFFEGNYSLLEFIDCSEYTNFFASFSIFLKERMDMSKRDYNIDSYHRDDDNNVYQDATYNIQGDFILQRAGNETDTWISQPLADYTVNSITTHRIEKLNESYQELLDQGVKVFFTFSPKNRNCLTEASTFEARKAVQNKLREELIIPVISDFEDSILPGTDFYLIDNHLSSEAARSRSQRVIHDLKTNISFSEDESLKAL